MEGAIMVEPITQMICYPPPPRKHLSPNPMYKKQFLNNNFNKNNNDDQKDLDIDVHFTRKSMAALDIMDELARRNNRYDSNTFTMGRFSFTTQTKSVSVSEPSSLPSGF